MGPGPESAELGWEPGRNPFKVPSPRAHPSLVRVLDQSPQKSCSWPLVRDPGRRCVFLAASSSVLQPASVGAHTLSVGALTSHGDVGEASLLSSAASACASHAFHTSRLPGPWHQLGRDLCCGGGSMSLPTPFPRDGEKPEGRGLCRQEVGPSPSLRTKTAQQER